MDLEQSARLLGNEGPKTKVEVLLGACQRLGQVFDDAKQLFHCLMCVTKSGFFLIHRGVIQ